MKQHWGNKNLPDTASHGSRWSSDEQSNLLEEIKSKDIEEII